MQGTEVPERVLPISQLAQDTAATVGFKARRNADHTLQPQQQGKMHDKVRSKRKGINDTVRVEVD